MRPEELDDADADPERAPTPAAALRLLAGVYRAADAAFAGYSCPASSDCCQLATTRRQPWLWPVEWEAVAARLRRDGREIPGPRSDGACPLLDADGRRCTVYSDRPFGCRTFFCDRASGPARQPVETVAALLTRLEALSRRTAPEVDAPRQILDWIAASR